VRSQDGPDDACAFVGDLIGQEDIRIHPSNRALAPRLEMALMEPLHLVSVTAFGKVLTRVGPSENRVVQRNGADDALRDFQ
jgi:hypothetical protein